MATHYASIQSLYADLTARTVTSMLDDDRDGVADPLVVEEVLTAVDDEINGYLASRFPTPLSAPLPAVVKEAARNLLAESLFKRRQMWNAKLSWAVAAKASREKLQAVKDRGADLDAGATAPARPGGMAITEPARTASRYGRLSV